MSLSVKRAALSAMYVCNYCFEFTGEFTGKQFSRYLRHTKFVHSNEPNFTFHVLNAKRLSNSSNHFGHICKEKLNE